MLMATEKNNLDQVRQAISATVDDPAHIRQPFPFENWYMALVRPNHEQECADSFRRNSVRAYWPNYERWQTYRDASNKPQQRLVLTSIMPGYIFSPGSQIISFESLIERITGVLNVVRTFSGNPLLLAESDIKIIRSIEAGLNTPQPAKSVHNFKTGQKVRFVDDLVGRWPPGKISKLAKDGRISVEVELMGRKVAVIVFPHHIERT